MRRFLIVCAVVLAVAYAIGFLLFLGSDDDSLPKGADAVVALAGSDNTLSAAQTLVGGGIAPTLVVSAQRNADDARTRLCGTKPGDVICIYAGPYSSVGEAQAVSELAKRRNWDTVVLVTSDYETFRAERAFRRCGDFRVATYGVDEPWWKTAIGIPLEWVKLAVSETVRRGC
jgi:uncharacterized SAM-binding protein YcdF (DUF218 family)